MTRCSIVFHGFLVTSAILAFMEKGVCFRSASLWTSKNGDIGRRFYRSYQHGMSVKQISSGTSAGDATTTKKRNLFKHQFDDYNDLGNSTVKERDGQRWQDIVLEEIAKNRNVEPSDDFLYGEHNAQKLNLSKITDRSMEPIKPSFNYRLSPEGRMKLEDRIMHLKHMANSEPGHPKAARPTLWIVRTTYGNYCELLEKDEDRIKSFVKRVRSHFTPDQLEILLMKLEVKMPLCEIFFEGNITDLVRIFYARGGTLQFYVTPRFWTRCPLLEKDPRLEAKYGKSTAPGLFPQWDEDGMVEELIDCMDTRPDYALEFRQPNAWQLIPMVPQHDRQLMETLFEKVHWPTRLRVQRAFEEGIEDYRDVISEEYKALQGVDRRKSNILDYWLPPVETG